MKENKTFKGSKKGIYIASVSAIVIALVIVLNLIVGQLPTNKVELDISGANLYNISYATEKYLADLNDDIEIIVVAQEGALDQRISKAIAGYVGSSSHISYTEIDPVKNPSVLETYDAADNTVIVKNKTNGRETTVQINGFEGDPAMLKYDLYAYYYNQQLVPKALDVDGQLTSAINIVTGESAGKAYILTNHGETTLSSTIRDRIRKLNIESGDLNLLMDGSIPGDCELLVCNNPTSDMTEEELSMIKRYLTDGGNMLLLIEAIDLNNFNSLLEVYGLHLQDGFIADPSRFYQTYASYYGYYCIAPELSTQSDLTSGIAADAMLLYPRAMLQVEPKRAASKVEVFMNSSDKAFTVNTDKEQSEARSFIIGAVATEDFDNNSDGTADYTSRFTVISAINLIDDSLTSNVSSISNLDVFMNAFSKNFDGTSSIVIPSRSLELNNNNMESLSFLGIFFIAIIPLAILVIGFTYWSSRRKK